MYCASALVCHWFYVLISEQIVSSSIGQNCVALSNYALVSYNLGRKKRLRVKNFSGFEDRNAHVFLIFTSLSV